MFDVVWSGRRHVIMGASQMDQYGNQNFAFIGEWGKVKSQLLGMRGAPGNTVNHTTSYWIPNHSTRVFVPKVDVVSGVGYDRAAKLGEWVKAHHEIRRVVTNLAVLDFATPDHRMRLASVHPGVTVDEVVEATGFELAIEGNVPESRVPTDEELAVHRAGRPHRSATPGASQLMHARLHTRSAISSASRCRSCRPGWAGSRGRASCRRLPRPARSGSSPAPPWTSANCRTPSATSRPAPRAPFGVNLRADAADINDRVKLLINEGVKVASFAQAPREDLIEALHDGGVLVVPSIGAKRHAEKVLEWGVDAVLVQGGEGGGHTGSVPTSLLLPQVVDAVDGAIPVIAAGGFFDGRGLVAALAYGADGIAMGTRFLLTADSAVPDAVKQFYLGKAVTETVVTTQVDGVPHRVLHTDLINELESTRGRIWAFPRALRNAWEFRRMTGIPLLRHGPRRSGDAEVDGAHLDADAHGGEHADVAEGRAGRRQGRVGGDGQRPGGGCDRRPADVSGAHRPHRQPGRRRARGLEG